MEHPSGSFGNELQGLVYNGIGHSPLLWAHIYSAAPPMDKMKGEKMIGVNEGLV